MEILETNFTPNYSQLFCKKCDFKCFKVNDWKRHVETKKHRYRHDGNVLETLETNFTPHHACNCGKKYKTHSGLWKHKKLCKNEETSGVKLLQTEFDKKDKDEIIMMLVKQNCQLIKETSECKNIMMEIIKNGTHNTTTTTNSNNKTFNLQFFLNEKCKDALNIEDFVSSVKLSLDDLEYTGRKGYIEGITNIIIKNLKSIEEYKRPIHCSDFKREILYIKDNDTWKKENEGKPVLTKAIKEIANENIKQINKWKRVNPECMNSESKKNNLYLKIVSNSMSGIDKEESDKNINKIISNVAKEVIINK